MDGNYKQTDSEFEMAVTWMVPNEDGSEPDEDTFGPKPSDINKELEDCPHIQFCNDIFKEEWISECANVVDTTPFIQVWTYFSNVLYDPS